MKYVKEFDSLRAIAVLSVMFSHFFAQFSVSGLFGSCGVTLFFVLSGYLITQILLKEKQAYNLEYGSNIKSLFSVLKVFYIRRALRIFPIYYITLAILYGLNFESTREYFLYHLFYLSNFLYSFKIEFDHLSHFWSLAVEEQFYLLWPFLILLTPARYLTIRLFLVLVAGSILFKFFLIWKYSFDTKSFELLMPSCVESFAVGAGAVLLKDKKIKKEVLLFVLVSSLTLFVLVNWISFKSNYLPLLIACKIVSRTIFSFFSATLLLSILQKALPAFVQWCFRNKILIGIGKISYGVYLYHMFVYNIMEYIQAEFRINLTGSGFYLLVALFITFSLAIVSYYAIETPIRKLKVRFAYR
ncbi:MAG: acyltransferase [Chitinophagaceae bacterium]